MSTAKQVLKKMPRLMKKFQVWCRNGEVCKDATPCAELRCKYKKSQFDIVAGTAKCQRFQLRTYSARFETSAMVAEPGSVDVER